MLLSILTVIYFRLRRKDSISSRSVSLTLTILCLSLSVHAQEEVLPKMPPAEEVKAETLLNATKSVHECQVTSIGEDLKRRFSEIQKRLEKDYNKGLPSQLKSTLIGLRSDVDQLSSQIFDVDGTSSQELILVTQKAISQVEKMIELLPKAQEIAPLMRNRYVIPFTNLASLQAEKQDCLMKEAIEQAQNEISQGKVVQETSGNIYRKLTTELEKMNKNLYVLQTSEIQSLLATRALLLKDLESFMKKKEPGQKLLAQLPQVLNSVHQKIEKVLPGLELSQNYYSLDQYQ